MEEEALEAVRGGVCGAGQRQRRPWDDDFVLKRQFSALIPAFDPRPGRTNLNQTVGKHPFSICFLPCQVPRSNCSEMDLTSRVLTLNCFLHHLTRWHCRLVGFLEVRHMFQYKIFAFVNKIAWGCLGITKIAVGQYCTVQSISQSIVLYLTNYFKEMHRSSMRQKCLTSFVLQSFQIQKLLIPLCFVEH